MDLYSSSSGEKELLSNLSIHGSTGQRLSPISKTWTRTRASRYRCIVVDPPWDQGKTGKRSVRPNQTVKLDYPTLTPEEIRELPINELAADNAFLWLWATNSRSKSCDIPILQIAFQLMEHWGFRYYTIITWDKRTGPCPFGPYQITTEHVLFGYKGKSRFPKSCYGKMKTLFSESTRTHSEKPSTFYEFVREQFDGPRLDLFARRVHEGFEGWGNQYKGNGNSST